MNKVSILFVREDSPYKSYPGLDCWDSSRDARNFNGSAAVVAHPPCRAWGRLSHLAKPAPGERELSLLALDIVDRNGGIVEHPAGSKLWKHCEGRSGFLLDINQYDFGHVASKPTKLYIAGISREQLPALPPKRAGKPAKSITGQVRGTARCTQYEREYTPAALIKWLLETAEKIEENKNHN